MTSAWLSRVEVRTDAGLSAIGPLLMPANASARVGASHRLIWSLFGDAADRARDFLWREDAMGRFMVLSRRAPDTQSPILRVESRPFELVLAAGERLRFMLRANPTVAPRGEGARRSDIVMHALYKLPATTSRAAERAAIAQRVGVQWLQRIGTRSGFEVEAHAVEVDGYAVHALPRPGADPMQFATLDFQGTLTVADPACFVECVLNGFGRARGFGCGLMLIRR